MLLVLLLPDSLIPRSAFYVDRSLIPSYPVSPITVVPSSHFVPPFFSFPPLVPRRRLMLGD